LPTAEALQKITEDVRQQVVQTAERYLGRHESGVNRGEWIDDLNRRVKAPLGSPWCASFACGCVLEVAARFTVTSKLLMSGSVRALWAANPKCRSQWPEPGYIACWGHKGTPSGHCGIVVDVDPKGDWFETIEGNTYDHGGRDIEREGDGVFRVRRAIKQPDSSPMVLLGFLRTF
jgi:hypothetical protein